MTAAAKPTNASTALYPSYPFTSSSREAIAQMPVTVIQAARERLIGSCIVPQPEVVPAGLSCAPVPASAHDLALRYLLELSTDIRGALLLTRDGGLLASAGHLAAEDLDSVGERLAAAAQDLSRNGRADSDDGGQASIEIDVMSAGGALFLLGEAGQVMACVTNRTVHPGLIFYDMHAVLRDLERAAAAEAVREHEGTS